VELSSLHVVTVGQLTWN